MPELLVGLMIGLMVAAGGMIILQIAVRSQPESSTRSAQIQEGRAMMERLSRELRQGESVEFATSTGLTINTYVKSASCGGPTAATAILCTVSYSCADGTCSRQEHDGSGGDGAQTVVTGLASDDVFRYCEAEVPDCEPAASASNPGYVEITLSYPRTDGDEAVTFTDGVHLRNLILDDPGAPPA